MMAMIQYICTRHNVVAYYDSENNHKRVIRPDNGTSTLKCALLRSYKPSEGQTGDCEIIMRQ